MIGLVGKPSSGKSTTLNALTDASAKVGAFPFTTIDPNKATGYTIFECACKRFDLQDKCRPNHGWCDKGRRFVPIVLLDVAGLVPGAHRGRGLGNKFLDDLRHADAFIHVVDVSGTTDSEGKATRGYNPSVDVDWLEEEIFRWVRGNLSEKWPSIVRRHTATKSLAVDTLANQFSGYGSSRKVVAAALDSAQIKAAATLPHEAGEPALGALETWDEERIDLVVSEFIKKKFPCVLALNKIDHPDADLHVAKVVSKHSTLPYVLTSAKAEVFLRKLAKQKYITYELGTEFVATKEDEPTSDLKEMDDKLAGHLETVRDLVLYRFGSTGVAQVLEKAVEALGLVPVYPVRNIHNYGGATVFPDCILVREGTTVGAVASKVVGDAPLIAIEGVGAVKLSEDDTVQRGHNDILSFRVGR